MEFKLLGFRTFIFYCFKYTFPAIISFVAAIFIAALPQTGILDGSPSAFGISADIFTNILWYIFGGLILATILIIIFGIIFAYIHFISCAYAMDDFGLKIKKGFLSKYETTIPFKQVQNVNVNQSILYRIIGIASVTILTAGNDNDDTTGEAEGELEIVDIHIAKYLHDTLLNKVANHGNITIKHENLGGSMADGA